MAFQKLKLANSIKRHDDIQPALILEGDVKITFYDNLKFQILSFIQTI